MTKRVVRTIKVWFKPSNTTIDVIKLFINYNCFGPL
jgi:hypothetical protein